MEILELILYLVAYTVGVLTLFLEIICYSRKIEYLETILFTAAFLLFIVSLSYSILFGNFDATEIENPNFFVLISMVLLALTLPLNIFAERQIKIASFVKPTLYFITGLLGLLTIANNWWPLQPFLVYLISAFLIGSVIASMLVQRNSKPEKRIEHRESIEQKISTAILIIIPITVFIEVFADKIEWLSFMDTKSMLTVPILFIILCISKLLDDLNRLSLFKSENEIVDQNVKNYNLTPRELEIAGLLIKGFTYAKISETLFISMPTVKTHVSNIYKKVQVNNKMELLNALVN